MRAIVQCVVVCGLIACSNEVTDLPLDAGEGVVTEDAGPPPDAGSVRDAGPVPVMDAGAPSDAGEPLDAGVPPLDAGAPPDAGTSPTDAGTSVDAGQPWCPPGSVFCESFEAGLDSTRWQTNGNAQAFSIDDTTPAQQGQRSLHLAYGVPYGHTGTPTIQLKTPPPAPDDRIYLRVWLRFGNLGLPGQHPAFISVSDSEGREQGFGSIINDFSMLAWTPGGLDNARTWYEGTTGWHPPVENGDATPTTENGLTAQTWFCLELMFFGDHQGTGDTQHAAEETKVWINGTAIPQLAESDALWRLELGHDPPEHWSPIYSGATWRFGLTSFGPLNAPIDLWFDSLVMSNSPIGCGP